MEQEQFSFEARGRATVTHTGNGGLNAWQFDFGEQSEKSEIRLPLPPELNGSTVRARVSVVPLSTILGSIIVGLRDNKGAIEKTIFMQAGSPVQATPTTIEKTACGEHLEMYFRKGVSAKVHLISFALESESREVPPPKKSNKE